MLTRICTLNGTVKESELLHLYHRYNIYSQRGSEDPLCPYTTSAPSASSERPGAGSCQISTITRPDIATFTLGASANTNRNIAREDVVQKHHQTAARCRRLLAGEPRHPWFVTKWGFSAAPEAPWPGVASGHGPGVGMRSCYIACFAIVRVLHMHPTRYN